MIVKLDKWFIARRYSSTKHEENYRVFIEPITWTGTDRKHIFRMHRDVRIEMRIVCRVNGQTSRRKSRDSLSFLRPFFLFSDTSYRKWRRYETSVGAVSTHRYIRGRSVVDFLIRGKKEEIVLLTKFQLKMKKFRFNENINNFTTNRKID